MIKNQRQYKITRARADEFATALRELQEAADEGDQVAAISARAVAGQHADLLAELAEFEALHDSESPIFMVRCLADLPLGLIRARIASGLTQKQLASRLGMRAQQIQRYEDTGYQSASLARILEVSAALQVELREGKLVSLPAVSAQKVLDRVRGLGLESNFVRRRIAPPDVFDGDSAVASTLELVERLSRIFGWSATSLLSDEQLDSVPLYVDAVAFRLHRRRNEPRLAVQTTYARYLAGLALKASSHRLTPRPLPSTPEEFLELLDKRYDGPNLHSVASLLWDHGAVVLPLNEPGGFQGAAWRIEGRNVAVLNTRSPFEVNWCHDLLHEACHLAQDPDAPHLEVVEEPREPGEVPDTEAEREAESFARAVHLRGSAEQLMRTIMRRSRRNIAAFKRVLPAVAKESNVDVGALANYVAWGVSLQDYDWWGAATNLKRRSDSFGTLRDEFFERVDVWRLDAREQDLLIRGLTTWEGDQ
jgi:transcriptional regulator with XRE-family HTH domain